MNTHQAKTNVNFFLQRLFFFIMMVCLLQSGCVFAPIKEHSIHYYTLSSRNVSGKTFFLKQNTQKIVVEPIVAQGFYNTRKMVYADQPLQLNYFVYQQWAAPPSQELTTELTNFLLKHDFAVADSSVNFSSRFQLKTELLDLKQDYTRDPPEALIGVRVQVNDMVKRRVVLVKTIYAMHPFYVKDAAHGVEALNSAKQILFRRIKSVLDRLYVKGSRE